MFVQGIKNYFKNLKHVFTPLGTMFLGLILGLSVFIPGVYHAIADAIQSINDMLHEISVNLKEMWQTIVNAFAALDWSTPETTLHTVFSEEWFAQTFTDNISTALGDSLALISDSLPVIIQTASGKIVLCAVCLILLFVLGIVAGYLVVASLTRREIAKCAWWKLLVAWIVDVTMHIVAVILIVWLAERWAFSLVFTVFAYIVLTTQYALFEAYFLQGKGKVPFKQCVNFKNMLSYQLSSLCNYAFTVVLVLLCKWLFNFWVTAVVLISLVEITLIVNHLNAESYIKTKAGEAQQEMLPSAA